MACKSFSEYNIIGKEIFFEILTRVILIFHIVVLCSIFCCLLFVCVLFLNHLSMLRLLSSGKYMNDVVLLLLYLFGESLIQNEQTRACKRVKITNFLLGNNNSSNLHYLLLQHRSTYVCPFLHQINEMYHGTVDSGPRTLVTLLPRLPPPSSNIIISTYVQTH